MHHLLMVFAFVLFVLAAVNCPSGRINLVRGWPGVLGRVAAVLKGK